MMDRPPQNQTNTPAKREEEEASLSKQEGRVCILHIPPDGWMTDYSLAAEYNSKQTCIHRYLTLKIIQVFQKSMMTQRIQKELKSCMTQCF